MKGKQIFILIFIFIIYNADSQLLVRESFRDVMITPEKDTLIITRSPGDWWFGPFASITPFSNLYFGKLALPKFKEFELQELFKKN